MNWRILFIPRIKDLIVRSWPYRIYFRYLLGKKVIRYSVEITTLCNLNCVMCTRRDKIKTNKLVVGNMDEVLLNGILVDMDRFVKAGYRVEFVPMGLGEPLMNKYFFDILTRVKKISNKIYIILVTNGVLLDKSKIGKLVSKGVDEICVSLNVNNSSDYTKYMRASDYYNKIVGNIFELFRIRNLDKLSKLKIIIQYLDYKNKPGSFNKNIFDWQKLMKNGDKSYVHPIVNQAGFKKGVTGGNISSFPCVSPLSRVAIRLNGDMYPCDPCFYGGTQKIKELYLGNIKEMSFYDLYMDRNSKIYEIVDLMKRNEYNFLPTCRKCNTYKLSGNPFFSLPWGMKIKGIKWF